MTAPRQTTLPELVALDPRDDAGRPLIEAFPLVPGQHIPVTPLAFGDTDFESRRIHEHPFADAWKETEYHAAPIQGYRLRGAYVHSSAGVVMLGDRLVAETLQHVYLPEHHMSVDPETGTTSLDSTALHHMPGRAVHLLAAGAYNYYHWQVDVLSRLSALPDEHAGDVLLVPPLDHAFQMDSFRRLATERPMALRAIPPGETLLVDELLLIPNFSGFGYYPRPAMLRVFDRLLEGVAPAAPHRRLYVSRADSRKRPLVNEAEIAGRLSEAGYEILRLDGMDLAGQIRAFAEATHIVAPHGAGLANVLFCRPGTAVCELQMDCYLNWLFRRLGNLRGLRYGCVLGGILGDWEPVWPHNSGWEIPPDHLWAVLRGAGFLDHADGRRE